MTAGRSTLRWGFVARLAVSVACLAALAVFIDGRALWAMMARLSPVALLVVLALHIVIIVLLAWRWQSIVRTLGPTVRFNVATRLTFATTFFNMILPLSIGGDIGRVWLGRGAGIDLNTGTTVAILDRITGVIALGFLLFVSALLLPSAGLPLEARLVMILLLPMMLVGFWLIAAFSGFGASHWLALDWLCDAATKVKLFIRRPGPLCLAIMQSLVAHLLAVTIVFVSAGGLAITLLFSDALLLVPVIVLATMLPFSIGGWGLREAAAIAVLALAGVSAEGALTLAVIFGISQIVVSGAGTLLYLGWAGLSLGHLKS